MVLGTDGAAGIITRLLDGGDFTIQSTEDVDQFRIGVDVSFRVIGLGEFMEENLRKASGSGLETDFGKFGSILAPEEIKQVILVEPVLEDVFLFEAPFQMAARGPIGD